MKFERKQCEKWTEIDCIYSVFYKFLSEQVLSNCSDECPIECESYSISTSVNSNSFTDKHFEEFDDLIQYNDYIASLVDDKMTQSQKYDIVRQHVLTLRIFYENLAHTYIEQSAKTELVDLVSNIGGTLGIQSYLLYNIGYTEFHFKRLF